MSEQIYTFTDEEVARMFKSGEMKLLTIPEPIKTHSDHEKALEKAKKLFGKDFEDVETLQIGGKTKEVLREELNKGCYAGGVCISHQAEELLTCNYFTTLPNPQNLEIIRLKVGDLGFNGIVELEEIYKKARKLGLGLCPAETGPYLRLKHPRGSSFVDGCYIAMEPIPPGSGVAGTFWLGIQDLLRSAGDNWWVPEERFIFSIPPD